MMDVNQMRQHVHMCGSFDDKLPTLLLAKLGAIIINFNEGLTTAFGTKLFPHVTTDAQTIVNLLLLHRYRLSIILPHSSTRLCNTTNSFLFPPTRWRGRSREQQAIYANISTQRIGWGDMASAGNKEGRCHFNDKFRRSVRESMVMVGAARPVASSKRGLNEISRNAALSTSPEGRRRQEEPRRIVTGKRGLISVNFSTSARETCSPIDDERESETRRRGSRHQICLFYISAPLTLAY